MRPLEEISDMLTEGVVSLSGVPEIGDTSPVDMNGSRMVVFVCPGWTAPH